MTNRPSIYAFAALAVLLLWTSPAHSGTVVSGWANITEIASGWVGPAGPGDDIVVSLDLAPFLNPFSCSIVVSYSTVGTDLGAESQRALLLAAAMAGRRVRLAIDDASCRFNRPKIVGIYVEP